MYPPISEKSRVIGAVAACIFCQLASSVHAEQFGLFTYTVIGGSTIEITDYPTGAIGAVIVPEEIDSKPVTSVGNNAFYVCSSLTSITLPSGVTSVGNSAFEFCSSLTSVTLPSGVTSVGSRAFAYCSGLTSITLPPGLTSVADFTFYSCISLTNITLPTGVISLGLHSFSGCNSLTNVTLRSGLTTMSNYAFQDCINLTSITLPSGLTSVGDFAFDGCSSLTSITLPSSVTSVGAYSFLTCSSLSAAYFSGDAPSLGPGAFTDTAPGFAIYYLSGSTGFTSPPWTGFTAVSIDESMYPAALWLLTHGYDYTTNLEQDLNGDGVELLMAYALNLNPHDNLTGQMPQVVMSPGMMSMTFYGESAGVIYQVGASSDLINWSTIGVTTSPPDVDGLRTASKVKDGPAEFMRLSVVEDVP